MSNIQPLTVIMGEANDDSIRFQKITVEQTLPLRHAVLWPDMPISQVCLPEDQYGLHLGAFVASGEYPVAVISLFVEPLPIDKEVPFQTTNGTPVVKAVRFRKFACDPSYQGKGIGTNLLSYTVSMAQSELFGAVLWCDARTASLEWYKKRGLLPFSSTFFKGPVEYIRMKMDLREKPEDTDIMEKMSE
ncbi:hypothetical protein BDQ12DRAFT_85736 [Crucibulum laeve]|uniref:N-acetyltransferase domain-containing protein n=1 Tax=Crucibulum laeve TaxID=68775 RepID=A0A5C3M0P9_9AGAR|nr:hypothetical protein BDQ12DRAFT_85736 [Crucibulum laeve]